MTGLKFGSAPARVIEPAGDLVTRAAAADRFKGKNGSALDIVAPAGLTVARLMVVGVRQGPRPQDAGFRQARRRRHGQDPGAAVEATILADLPGGVAEAGQAADLALGVQLRAYAFDRYKTKRKEGEDRPPQVKVTIAVANVAAVEKAWAPRAGGWRTGSCSRAIWSTSRPTCSTRRNSPAAPPR